MGEMVLRTNKGESNVNDKEKKCVKQAIAAHILAEQQRVKDKLNCGIEPDIELQKILTAKLPDMEPSNKTLSSLWEMYGLNNHDYYPHQQLDLFKRWVVILYGERVAKDLKIQNRFDKIAKQQSDAHAACDKSSTDIDLFFRNPIDIVIMGITYELPEYS